MRPYAHSEPLARAIELLLIKLPDADGPVRTRQTPLPARVRKLLASEVAQIMIDYQEGATVGQLAKTFSVDRNTIGRILQKAGVPQHPRGLTDGHITEAVQIYESGVSLARIGSRFGVDAHTVRRRLIERGVAMRDIHGRSR